MSDLLSRGVKTTGQAIGVALPHFIGEAFEWLAAGGLPAHS